MPARVRRAAGTAAVLASVASGCRRCWPRSSEPLTAPIVPGCPPRETCERGARPGRTLL